jgi:anionic cell wall polymer biosynthesis LytR-Cps2A-Psr (LCP) family protein
MLGAGALSYARNRHIPNGDIARTEHQGQLLIGGLERAREVGRSPFEQMRMLSLISRHTHFEGVDLRDLYTLITLGVSIDPANVRNVTMPAGIGKVGAADVVFVGAGANELFADFRDDAILQAH